MATETNYRIKGPQKAAALALSLGEENLTKIFKYLDRSMVKSLSLEMANLRSVEAKDMEGIFKQFTQSLTRAVEIQGGVDKTEEILRKVFSEDRVVEIMKEVKGPLGPNMWEQIHQLDEDMLINFLMDEHPQTVAVFLSKVRSEMASKLLKRLPRDVSEEVVVRMLKLEDIPSQILQNVEESIRQQFMRALSRKGNQDRLQVLADIFNFLDAKTETHLMSKIEQVAGQEAEAVRKLMFTYEDIVRISDVGIQNVIRSVDKTKLATALKGSSEKIKDKFFNNMSERAKKLTMEDMETMGPVRVREVEEAQNEILVIIKELTIQGEVVINISEDEERVL